MDRFIFEEPKSQRFIFKEPIQLLPSHKPSGPVPYVPKALPGASAILGPGTYFGRQLRGEPLTADLPLVNLAELSPDIPELKGIAEVATGLMTPRNLALVAGTGFLGSIPGAAAAKLPAIASGIFSVDLAKSAYQEFPEFKEAVNRGDTREARRIGARLLATGALAGLAGRHAGKALLTKAKEPVKIELKAPRKRFVFEEPVKPVEPSEIFPEVPGLRVEPGKIEPALATAAIEAPSLAPALPVLPEPLQVKSEVISPKRRTGFKVSQIGDEPDLLNHIDQLGGIKPKGPKSDPANYDGFNEAVRPGESRILIRKQTGLAPDDLRQALNNNYGYALEDTSQLYDAIAKVKERREQARAMLKPIREAEQATESFEKGALTPQKGKVAVLVSELSIGDRFKVKGKEFVVKEISPEGEVTVEDGRRFPAQTLLDQQTIYPEKGSYQPAEQRVGFEAPAQTIAGFNLQAAAVQEQLKAQRANEIVGELGMKAAGPVKSVTGAMEGSPLFGTSQKSFLGEESGAAPLNPLGPVLEAYTAKIGTPLWNMIERLGTEITPRGLRLRPDQPLEYQQAAQQRTLRISQGREKAIGIGRGLTQNLDQALQQELGRFIKGEVSEQEIKALKNDPAWNDAVETAKLARAEMDDLGGAAVTQGILKDETFFKNFGKYLPRLYRKWEVDYEQVIKNFGDRKPTRLDLERFKKRQDIPEEIRILMGEILEPGYPVAKGLSQLGHDVETAKLFNYVANNTEWTYKGPEDIFYAGKRASDFVKMPITPKLGRLSGQYVLKGIADDINQIIRSRTESEKISRALMSEWKFSKVILNPATHARNLYSNFMLADLGGLPFYRIDIYSRALFDLKRQGEFYQQAKQEGLMSSTYQQAEFDALLDSWNASSGSMWDRLSKSAMMLKQEAKRAEGIRGLLLSRTKLGQKAAKLYQASEQWFKLAKFIHNQEQGMAPREAALDANKWLFDYSEVPTWIDWARKSPFGSPFITFTYKALPAIAESVVKTPWRIAGLLGAIYGVQEYSAKALGLEPNQRKELESVMPERMKGKFAGTPKFLLLPFKDKYDQLQFLDLTYILPWGDIGETGATGIPQTIPLYAGPAKMLYEVMINKSSFTGKEIYRASDSTQEAAAKISAFLYRGLAPSLAPGGYSETKLRKSLLQEPDYFGRTKSVPAALLDVFAGLKTTPIDIKKERFFRAREIKAQIEDLKTQMSSLRYNQSLDPTVKLREVEKLRSKIQKLQPEILKLKITENIEDLQGVQP